jgi:hypothetical protein
VRRQDLLDRDRLLEAPLARLARLLSSPIRSSRHLEDGSAFRIKFRQRKHPNENSNFTLKNYLANEEDKIKNLNLHFLLPA